MVFMKDRTYFEAPAQVVFKESPEVIDKPRWIGGIAFHDEIICCECGVIVKIKNTEQIIELPWKNISKEIINNACQTTVPVGFFDVILK